MYSVYTNNTLGAEVPGQLHLSLAISALHRQDTESVQRVSCTVAKLGNPTRHLYNCITTLCTVDSEIT